MTVGAGMNLVNLPIYLGNCAPKSLRGAMINSYVAVVCEYCQQVEIMRKSS